MSNIAQLHIQIVTHLQTLKRELDKLSVRQAALLRSKKMVTSERSSDDSEDETEAFDDILANIDAIEYDLTSFQSQMRERLNHAERGLRLITIYSDEKNAGLLYQHILDGVQLCVSDAMTARDGYDELIENLRELTHLRDV